VISSRAPLRIDLAGGWTDVPAYASRHGGAVVNVAISLYVHTSVRRGGSGVRLRALDLGTAVSAQRVEDLRADGELALVKAVTRRRAPTDGGLEITTRSDAPPGSGLGGSGALGVALVAAMDAIEKDVRLPAETAGIAFNIETEDAGIVGGSQDQYAAALGGIQCLVYGEPSVSSVRATIPAATRLELERHLVLCYTGASRFSSDTHQKVWQAFDRGDADVRKALDGIKACAFAMRAALENGDVGQVGVILSENWRHQQELADGMQTDTMRHLERVAVAAGADGAKACGAGAGGCLVFLARPGRDFDVAEALRGAGGTILKFGFEDQGVVAWESLER
jgi:D-glycero-alpha-D-manno-heptose-7-phosphate kinase